MISHFIAKMLWIRGFKHVSLGRVKRHTNQIKNIFSNHFTKEFIFITWLVCCFLKCATALCFLLFILEQTRHWKRPVSTSTKPKSSNVNCFWTVNFTPRLLRKASNWSNLDSSIWALISTILSSIFVRQKEEKVSI